MIIAATALFALAGWVVMMLWNWLLPELTGFKTITVMQSYGLLLLSRILFASGGGKVWGRAWKSEMRERMDCMSPEEKARFKAKWEQRCSQWNNVK